MPGPRWPEPEASVYCGLGVWGQGLGLSLASASRESWVGGEGLHPCPPQAPPAPRQPSSLKGQGLLPAQQHVQFPPSRPVLQACPSGLSCSLVPEAPKD